MQRKTYEYYYNRLNSREDLVACAREYPSVSYNTLLSLYIQKQQEWTRKTYYWHNKEEVIEQYVARYLAGEELLHIAQKVGLAPTLLVRFVLQFNEKQILQKAQLRDSEENEKESEEVDLVHEEKPDSYQAKTGINSLLKNPQKIADKRLREEISRCLKADDVYSPQMDKIRHTIGVEYEYILQEKLRNLGIPFITEEELRKRQYFKTPDIKLEVPIIVDGHLINWIDSKASFGDDHHHQTNKRDQFYKYNNRFGSGMVIYWFGYIEGLNDEKDKILLMDHFPPTDLITTLKPSVW